MHKHAPLRVCVSAHTHTHTNEQIDKHVSVKYFRFNGNLNGKHGVSEGQGKTARYKFETILGYITRLPALPPKFIFFRPLRKVDDRWLLNLEQPGHGQLAQPAVGQWLFSNRYHTALLKASNGNISCQLGTQPLHWKQNGQHMVTICSFANWCGAHPNRCQDEPPLPTRTWWVRPWLPGLVSLFQWETRNLIPVQMLLGSCVQSEAMEPTWGAWSRREWVGWFLGWETGQGKAAWRRTN